MVEALSTRPQHVTGGDVLVGITVPEGVAPDSVQVSVDGRDVTSAFTPPGGQPDGQSDDQLRGLVDGLPEGESTITVTTSADEGEAEASRLVVTNHPISGPVFSGPHQEPFVCTTVALGLGPATDDDCSAPTVTETETLASGATYTVEKGVIDRSVYSMAFPDRGWNGRLVYRFGGGCGTTYSQGSNFSGVDAPQLLDDGYAVVTSTLNTFQTACNDVLSAEVTMMVKEHFIETHGVPDFTIGDGGSGGAIQQLEIAQNYPGLLDALAPSVPFPDAISIAPGITDCGLLLNYYTSAAGSSLTDAQRQAINGHRTTATCMLWAQSFLPAINPFIGCSDAVPALDIYDPVLNPTGTRCTLQDSNVNLFGTDPANGFAWRALDNTGVAYGLGALSDGVIDAEQFVSLNEQIGGYDIDGALMAARHTAPADVFERTYATGRVVTGDSALQDVPIIATNVYTDDKGDIHDRQRVFALRARLAGPDGPADPNLAIWTIPSDGDLLKTLTGSIEQSGAVVVLDQWLTAAAADTSDAPWSRKLADNRPAGAADRCILPDGSDATGPGIYDEGTACTQAYPVASDPRRVAGAPLANDILACQKRPVGALSTTPGVALSADQVTRLEAVFPDGVCDWTKPGIGQVPLSGTWISY